MPIDQGHAHVEVLGHPHQGVVDGRIAVGVVLTKYLTDHTGAFPVGPVAGETQLIHGVKDAPVHRLEAIAGIGQGPTHDHAHRILQIGARHLVAQIGQNDSRITVATGLPRNISTGSAGVRHG